MSSKNWVIFNDWSAGMSLDDYVQFISENGDDFVGRTIARAAGLGNEAAVRQNDKIRCYLEGIKQDLRDSGQMRPQQSPDNTPPLPEGANKERKGELTRIERRDYERIKQEVLAMGEELRHAKTALKRYGKMEEYLAEFGVLPR